jgi:hypothetical protein
MLIARESSGDSKPGGRLWDGIAVCPVTVEQPNIQQKRPVVVQNTRLGRILWLRRSSASPTQRR